MNKFQMKLLFSFFSITFIVMAGLGIVIVQMFPEADWVMLTVSFSAAFVLIVLITLRITNKLVEPIKEATQVANSLADGDYKVRIAIRKNDEVGQLSRSLNVLAYQLSQVTKRHQIQQERMETLIENMDSGLIFIDARGDISLINKTCQAVFQENTDNWLHQLYHDVLKYKEINDVIQRVFMTEKKHRGEVKISTSFGAQHFTVSGAPVLSEKGMLKGIVVVFHDITDLKKLEQIRKDFVANVSHELKTPITSIKGFTETLLDGAMEEKELREKFLLIMKKESERLQNLVQDLLELSKIERQYFELNWQATNIAALLEDVSELLKSKAEEKNIELSYNVEGELIVEADPIRVKQILINVVHNAINYTLPGGKVTINYQGMENEWLLTVRDTGIGMKKEEISRIFERFYRVDRARSRNSGGTGLGLAIVKHLVEAHNGRLTVDSEVGKGTTFTFVFNRNAS